jgi:hypothetical protein
VAGWLDVGAVSLVMIVMAYRSDVLSFRLCRIRRCIVVEMWELAYSDGFSFVLQAFDCAEFGRMSD